MPVLPMVFPSVIVPNYWSFTTLSFNRSQAYPGHPEYGQVFPNDLHVYDINGDGHLDILQVYAYIPAQNLPGIPIRVLLGDGHGNFTDGTASLFPGGAPLGDAATGSTIADFNGDGVLDIYIGMTWETASPIPRHDILLLSDGNGGVIDASDTLPTINDYTHWTTGGDIDGDGDIDVYVGNLGGFTTGPDGDITSNFLINDGAGNFTRSDTRLPETIEDGTRIFTSSLLFDADGDGDLDLLLGAWGRDAALKNNGADVSVVLFNDGTGHFSETAASSLPAPLTNPLEGETLDMVATDLDGDGRQDLLLLQHDDSNRGIQVLINNGDGTFRDETQARLSAYESEDWATGRYMHLTDINADGALDLVLQTGGPSRFYLNDGTGHFVALPGDFVNTSPPNGNFAFVPGDFNEDGRTDLFVRMYTDSNDPNNVTEFDWIALWNQPTGTVLTGNDAANAVLGTALAETLSGLGGDDVIFGGAGADVITGGAGADTMVGGAGADRFSDTAANLNGDTIRDLSAGDRIVITNASLAGFTFSVSGQTLTFTGGSLTLGSSLSGMTIAASAAAGGGVQLALVINDARNDFDGDGRSDILWRHDNGTIADWLGTASGGFSPNNPSVTNSPLNWHIAGTGDFNGDGRDDLLWRSQTGEVGNWLAGANGTHGFNAAAGIVAVPNNWQVQGVGDFNGDGRDDILWRSDAGEIGNWLGTASGGFTANNAQVVVIDAYWQIQGTGDFNGDGYDDVLWRGGNGEVGTWLGNAIGAFAYNSSAGLAAAPGNWQIVGTGDFNGDNRDDIVWRSDIGEVGTWLANPNGSFTANNAQVVMVSTAWHIADVGDFNGDNVDDLLWRHDNGLMTNWLGQTSGFWLENNAAALTHLPVDWTIQAPDSLLV